MNIAARTELMAVLTELSTLMPYMRLGQLISYLAERAETPWTFVVPEIEDEELLTVTKELLEDMKRLPPEHFADQIRGHLESDRYAQQAAG